MPGRYLVMDSSSTSETTSQCDWAVYPWRCIPMSQSCTFPEQLYDKTIRKCTQPLISYGQQTPCTAILTQAFKYHWKNHRSGHFSLWRTAGVADVETASTSMGVQSAPRSTGKSLVRYKYTLFQVKITTCYQGTLAHDQSLYAFPLDFSNTVGRNAYREESCFMLFSLCCCNLGQHALSTDCTRLTSHLPF